MQLTLEKVTLRKSGLVYYAVFLGGERKIATNDLEKAKQKYDMLKKELAINPPYQEKESEYLTETLQTEKI